MSRYLPLALSALIGVVFVIFPAQDAKADVKGVSSSACHPYGPGTTAAELQFSQNAIYNLSATPEKILCPVNKDFWGQWTDANPAVIQWQYRTTTIAGAVACTAFIGSPAGYDSPIQTTTINPPTLAPNSYASTAMNLRSPVGGTMTIENVNFLCTLSPKVKFAGFWFYEVPETGTP